MKLRFRTKPKGIAAAMLFATGGVAVLTFLLGALIFTHESTTTAEAATADTLARIASSRARMVALWFDARRMLVETAAEDIGLRPIGPGVENSFRHKALLSEFLGTYVGSEADGAFFNFPHLRALPPGYDARLRPWYRQAATFGRTVLTEPYRDASLDAPVVTLATPLRSGLRLRGVVGADFSIAALERMLRRVAPAGTYTFIANAQGKVLVHPDQRLVGRSLAAAFDGVAPAMDGSVTSTTSAGRREFVLMTPIDGLPSARWYVGIALDARAVAAGVWKAHLRALTLVLAVVVSCLIMVWLALDRLVLRPIRRLTAEVRRVGGRSDETEAGQDRSDEIAELTSAISAYRRQGDQLAALTAAEAEHIADEAVARRRMMDQLQRSFGAVVDAAVAGDLSGRIQDGFADEELNALARSVNRLVAVADRGLTESGEVLAALARADLTRRVSGDYQGAFDRLKQDTNALAERLGELVGELRGTSGQMRSATDALAVEAGDLSSRTAEQGEAVEDATAAARRLALTLDATGRRTTAAGDRAREAADLALGGSEAMAEARLAMERLHATSGSVSRVITMLDEIASQTALLALNATIEAARAGEAGRGFGVVAGEVKRLAAQAADASCEAGKLIGETVEVIGSGVEGINAVSERLSTLLATVADNRAHLDEIGVASRAQAAAVAEIGGAIARMNAVTRANAELVTSLNHTTDRTRLRATDIDSIVRRFDPT